MSNFKIADPKLADAGRLKIEWAESRMPVLMSLREKGKKDLPLKGMKVAGCLHVTKETAVLIRTIRAAGAEVSWSGCNPLSTQDDVAAALAAEGTSIYAWHGLSRDEFYWCIDKTLEIKPTLTLDDGADLIFTVHDKHQELAAGRHRRHRGDHHRRAPPARHGQGGQAALPGHRGQRQRDQVGLRQRLRHRAVVARRHPARQLGAARRQDLRGGRLRPLRPRRRHARARAWAPTSSSPRSSRPPRSRRRSTASGS